MRKIPTLDLPHEVAPATDVPRWEALYEPGNVSSYLIGYLNGEAPAKAAAEAWLRSQTLDQPGALRWDEFQMDPARFGYDVEYRLREIDEDGVETESGILVQHRADQPGETP